MPPVTWDLARSDNCYRQLYVDFEKEKLQIRLKFLPYFKKGNKFQKDSN